jgi:hypothetical protein
MNTRKTVDSRVVSGGNLAVMNVLKLPSNTLRKSTLDKSGWMNIKLCGCHNEGVKNGPGCGLGCG